MQILIVEDVAAVGRATARLLRRSGYTVATVGSCLEGSALRDRFVCGVFDIDLPDGNGIELAKQMLIDGRVGVAVFFSGCTDAETLERARRVGRFVSKPEGVGKLVRTVAELLREPPEPTFGSVRNRRQRHHSGIRRRGGAPPPRASGSEK